MKAALIITCVLLIMLAWSGPALPACHEGALGLRLSREAVPLVQFVPAVVNSTAVYAADAVRWAGSKTPTLAQWLRQQLSYSAQKVQSTVADVAAQTSALMQRFTAEVASLSLRIFSEVFYTLSRLVSGLWRS